MKVNDENPKRRDKIDLKATVSSSCGGRRAARVEVGATRVEEKEGGTVGGFTNVREGGREEKGGFLVKKKIEI